MVGGSLVDLHLSLPNQSRWLNSREKRDSDEDPGKYRVGEQLMWVPFETTTFRDGVVTGTHHSASLFRNANTLGLVWDLH